MKITASRIICVLIGALCTLSFVSCSKDDSANQTLTFEQQLLKDNGISFDNMAIFRRSSVLEEQTADGEDVTIMSLSAYDDDFGYLFLFSESAQEGVSDKDRYKLLSKIKTSRPAEFYTMTDVGYGKKLYKAYGGPMLMGVKYFEQKEYFVIADYYSLSETEPRDPRTIKEGDLINVGFGGDVVSDYRIIIRKTPTSAEVIVPIEKYLGPLIAGTNGICTGTEYYSDEGVKQYDVFQYCYYGYPRFYWDEQLSYAPMNENPRETWIFPLSDTQFFRFTFGINPRGKGAVNEVGPAVFNAAIEDFKEGAYYWRSWNIISTTDNNLYNSIEYSGKTTVGYSFIAKGVQYSGQAFEYKFIVSPENKSITIKDVSSGQDISYISQLNDGYSKIR